MLALNLLVDSLRRLVSFGASLNLFTISIFREYGGPYKEGDRRTAASLALRVSQRSGEGSRRTHREGTVLLP